MLEFSPGFSNYEWYLLRTLNQFEMAAENFFQAIQSTEAFAVALESANPSFPFGMFFQPGIRRCNQQKAAEVKPVMDGRQEFGRIIEAIDQVGGKDQVIAGEQGFKITGVALVKFYFMLDRIEAKTCQRTFLVKNEITLIREGIAQHSLAGKLDTLADEAGGKVDPCHIVEMPGQFES